MFDIGWSEMLVIAVIMIVVVGPKDLPKMLRTVGKMTAKMRSMAGDFQRQFNEALKEAELDEVKKSVDSLRSMNPVSEVKKQLNPFEKAAAEVRAGLQSLNPTVAPPAAPAADAAQSAQAEQAAAPVTHEAEPLKNGATAMPGVAGPEVMPAPPVLATPAPSPEPAKPGAPATLMADPAPARANGAAAPVAVTAAPPPKAPAKTVTKARSAVSKTATKTAPTQDAAKAAKSASKPASDKPKTAAKAPAKSKAVASDKKSGKTT